MWMCLEPSLLATLVVGAAFTPWAAEVAQQLRMQARFLTALPPDARAALPAHPRRPSLAFLGSPRFQLAFWRSIRRDLPDDPAEVTLLKRQMRASVRRLHVWMAGGFVVAAAFWACGWRPALLSLPL